MKTHGLVGSLKSSHKEAPRKPLLCEDDSDLTSPTSNQIPDKHIAVSVVYDIQHQVRYKKSESHTISQYD